MTERDRREEGSSLATMAGADCCTFCGRPDGRPLHGMPEISVCGQCLRTACKEMLAEQSEVNRL